MKQIERIDWEINDVADILRECPAFSDEILINDTNIMDDLIIEELLFKVIGIEC